MHYALKQCNGTKPLVKETFKLLRDVNTIREYVRIATKDQKSKVNVIDTRFGSYRRRLTAYRTPRKPRLEHRTPESLDSRQLTTAIVDYSFGRYLTEVMNQLLDN
jgi:hypothetical protein